MLNNNEKVLMRKEINKFNPSDDKNSFKGSVLLYEYIKKDQIRYGTCIEHENGKTEFYNYDFDYEDALRNFENRNSLFE